MFLYIEVFLKKGFLEFFFNLAYMNKSKFDGSVEFDLERMMNFPDLKHWIENIYQNISK